MGNGRATSCTTSHSPPAPITFRFVLKLPFSYKGDSCSTKCRRTAKTKQSVVVWRNLDWSPLIQLKFFGFRELSVWKLNENCLSARNNKKKILPETKRAANKEIEKFAFEFAAHTAKLRFTFAATTRQTSLLVVFVAACTEHNSRPSFSDAAFLFLFIEQSLHSKAFVASIQVARQKFAIRFNPD